MNQTVRTTDLSPGRRAADSALPAVAVSPARRLWTLSAHFFRGQLVNALIWGLILGLMGAMYVALFPSMGSQLDSYIESLPEGMKAFLPSLEASGSVEAWLNMEMFSMLAPLALPFFVIIFGARAIAGREERGQLDLLLSNPVPRWTLVVGTYLTMAAALVVALVPLYVLTLGTAPLVDVDLDARALFEATLNLLPICLVFGSTALLLSAFMRRASLAIVIPAALLVGMYVLQGLGNYSPKIEPFQALGIFYYHGSALTEGLRWLNFAGLLGLSFVLTAMAAVAFYRREIYT